MAFEVAFYHARFNGGALGIASNKVGSFATGSAQYEFPWTDLGINTGLQTHAGGEGDLWVYSKHFPFINTLDGSSTAKNFSVCLLYNDPPEVEVEFALAANYFDRLDGTAFQTGAQTGLPWWPNDDDGIPEFVKADGWDNALLLKQDQLNPGDSISVGPATGNTAPFWIRRKFPENFDYNGVTGTGIIKLGFKAEPDA